jgi:two-component system catabolic regulation response regulator CreB
MAATILVVEDEPAIADNIAYALKTDGFGVVCCGTGAEALEALAREEIALIVLDVGLPDRNGFDLCKEIRRTSGVPVIFLTARTAEVDRVVGLEIGGDDYVSKPFSPRELSARVKAVLRRVPSGDEGEDTRVDAPFVVDGKRRVIRFLGTPLDLSRYEYGILALLLERPGWVYSREQIMDRVWEDGVCSTDRTVDTHVKTLRAKLREVRSEADPIKTHRGVGYSLKESW